MRSDWLVVSCRTLRADYSTTTIITARGEEDKQAINNTGLEWLVCQSWVWLPARIWGPLHWICSVARVWHATPVLLGSPPIALKAPPLFSPAILLLIACLLWALARHKEVINSSFMRPHFAGVFWCQWWCLVPSQGLFYSTVPNPLYCVKLPSSTIVYWATAASNGTLSVESPLFAPLAVGKWTKCNCRCKRFQGLF